MRPGEMKRKISSFAIANVLVWYLVAGCSAPEDENPGYCRLSCTNTTLAASDFDIASKTGGLDDLQCSADEAVSVNPRWLVTADIQQVDGSKIKVERSGIGFAPEISSISQGRIVTPDTEWCSDACGVASILFELKCDPAMDASYALSLQSGAVSSDVVDVTLRMPEE